MDSVAGSTSRARAQLFQAAETKDTPHIAATIIEKDFWVCWVLHRLFEMIKFRPQLIFKGGTSLSKAYKVINRFSEDVDLSLSRRDLGFIDKQDPEQTGIGKNEGKRRLKALVEQCRLTVHDRLLPELSRDFFTVLGSSGWSVEMDAIDQQTVIFSYPPSDLSSNLEYVRPVIRLEMGARSDDWPAIDAEIKPYAAERFPNIFILPVCCIRTLAAERTFWEKATLLHAEYHRPQNVPLKERLARHYYDLYCLSRTDLVNQALQRIDILERVVEHKSFFFASSWAHYRSAKPGSFHLLSDKNRLDALRKDFEAMHAVVFGEMPRWDAVIQELTSLEDRINKR